MKSLILHDDEVRTLQDTGEVTVVRPMKKQPPEEANEVFTWYGTYLPPGSRIGDEGCYYVEHGNLHFLAPCPFGKPGQRRWVKESLWISECGGYYAREIGSACKVDILAIDGSCIWYASRYQPKGWDDTDRRYTHAEFPHMVAGWSNEGHYTRRGRWISAFTSYFYDLDQSVPMWRSTEKAVQKEYRATFRKRLSAVHMPQWASRLTAECASVTVQQREGVWEWHAVYRRLEPRSCQI